MRCQRCKSSQKCVCLEANHLLHLWMTVLTVGFWVPVWIVLALRASKRWHCDACGSEIIFGRPAA